MGERLLVVSAFLGLALAIYRPAFEGEFLFDDHALVRQNLYVQELSLANTLAILDPSGEPAKIAAGYKPLNLLLHALEWQVFGTDVLGYHVVNAVAHALAALLLVLVFERFGLDRWAAILGGALFLTHPVQVEVVAWISQLKTLACMAFSLAALLLFSRHRGAATLCFALGLLTKLTATFVVPVLAVHAFLRGRLKEELAWIAAWIGLTILYFGFELAVTLEASSAAPLSTEPFELARSILVVAGRYLVMAATGLGIAPFHEPYVAAWTDPRWIGSLALILLLAWRGGKTLLARKEEAVFWVWAAAAFVPVSQLVPFIHPTADRYLYFLLPGLLGGVLSWAGTGLGALPSASRKRVAVTAGVLAVMAATAGAFRSHAQAAVWTHPRKVISASAEAFPDGLYASLQRATDAGRVGDAEGVVAALEQARRRGYNDLIQVFTAPELRPVRRDRDFRALVETMAREQVTAFEEDPPDSQYDARVLGLAHFILDDRQAAMAALRAGIEMGGAYSPTLQRDIRFVLHGEW